MTNQMDPLPAYSFYIEVNGIWEAGFTACSGLRVKRETQVYKEGGVNDYVHTLPGRISYSNITLKQGITFSDKLWLWYINGTLETDLRAPAPWFKDQVGERKAGVGGVAYLDNMAIVQCIPYEGTVVRRYYLQRAFPVSWSGPNFDTNSNQVAVESLEIAIQKFTIDSPPRQVTN